MKYRHAYGRHRGELAVERKSFHLDFAIRLKQTCSKMYSINILYCSNCSNNFYGN
jgi:hypothetical protein